MLDAIALGELLIDFATVDTDRDGYPTLAAHPGGAPGNFLAALHAYGCSGAMLGKVGADTFGDLLCATLAQAGIRTEGIVRDPSVFTTLAFVTFGPGGERAFSFARKPGADTQLRFDELDLSLLDEARLLHFGSLSLTQEPVRSATQQAAAYAAAHGKLLSFDPNLRLPLWPDAEAAKTQILWGLRQADIVKISDDEVRFLWGCGPEEGAARLLADFGVRLAMVTCGPKGCLLQNAGAAVRVAAPRVLPVDTTGAGDIFGGSAVSRLLQLGRAPEALTEDELAAGVTLLAVQTEKFKSGCFSFNLMRPHTKAAAPLDALLPSVLLRGSERWPDMRAISMRLDELYGATLGTLVRLRGETKLTGFYADFIEEAFLPAGEAVFAPMVEFFRDILFHPALENGLLNARYVESEKQNLIHAIESAQNDKRVYAAMRMRRIMCEGEAASIPRLGYAEDVAAITPEALTAHWRTVLRTAPIMLFYAGRRTPQEAAALFRPLFDGLERDPVSPPPTVVRRSAETVREVTESMDVTQGKLVIGMRTGITASDPDYPALVLLNSVYGSGVTSKLFVNVREKRSLCYYASSAVEKFKGLMIVSSGISFDQYETARDAILAELDACRRGEITPEELESARRSLISAVRAGLDTPAALDDWYIGMSIEPCDDPETMLQKLPALTVGDVVRAARRITTDTIYFLKGDEA